MRKTFWLSFSALSFLSALFAGPGAVQGGLDAAALAAVAAADPGALRHCGSLRFWVFPAIFFLLSPFFIGLKDTAVGGLGYSVPQLESGLGFLLHAYAFVALAAAAGRGASAQGIMEKAEKWGLRSAGLRLALALTVVKMLRRMLTETFGTYRLQRPRTWDLLRELHVYAGAVVRNSVRIAEDISVLFYVRNVRI